MKLFDRVELINERSEYTKAGVKVGDKGIVMGEKRIDWWLVYFDGEMYQDEEGTWCTTEVGLGVLEEDLKVIDDK